MIMDISMSEKPKSSSIRHPIIMISVLCVLVGILIGIHASIHQIEGSNIFDQMAEGMTCESMITLYNEDPEPRLELSDDKNSWWYVGIEANDAMGNEIIKRCT